MYALKQLPALGLATLCLASAQAASDAPALLVTPPPSPATQYVRDLLILDAAAALRAEVERAQADIPRYPRGAAPAYLSAPAPFADTQVSPIDERSTGLSAPHEAMQLKAILGVGTRLSALVDIDGQTLLYRAGRAAALSGPHAGIRLVKVTTPCVEFLLANGQSDTRCISEVSP